jgi:hypothetical protein
MVYVQGTAPPPDIWRVPGRTASAPHRAPEKLIASSQVDVAPAYSPDGRNIAFQSDRSGAANIWICSSDGSDPVQLTNLPFASLPRWSPDGRRLVFYSEDDVSRAVHVVDVGGGRPRRLTHGPSDDYAATWSRDGEWIYFVSDRSGVGQIWKMPADGGEAAQVTHGGGFYGEESWDGKHLYFFRSFAPLVWRMPVGGGEETAVWGSGVWNDFVLSRDGIYQGSREEGSAGRTLTYTIHYYDFESAEVTDVFREEGPFLHLWLAVSPDEEWILFSRSPLQTSELTLVENFR